MNQQQQQQQTMDDTVAQMRFIAMHQRRAAPPRCHPFSIVVLVQSFGLIFIGLTMTVIANWPGMIGSNPLKIAGPILLAIGFVVFVIGVLLARFLKKKEAKKWTQKVNTMAEAASKQMLNQSTASLPHYLSTKEEEAMYPEEKRPLYGEPDYTDRQHPSMDRSAEDEEEDLPEPVRTKKKKKDASMSSMDHTTEQSIEYEEDVFNNAGAAADVPDAVRKKKKKKVRSKENLAEPTEMVGLVEDEDRAAGYHREEFTSEQRIIQTESGADRRPKTKPKPPVPTKPLGPPPESPRLRVHVKALPGTAVHIHHGTETPPQSSRKQHNQSTASVETDI